MGTLLTDFLIEPSEKAHHVRAKHICKACCGSGYDWEKEIGVIPNNAYNKLFSLAAQLVAMRHQWVVSPRGSPLDIAHRQVLCKIEALSRRYKLRLHVCEPELPINLEVVFSQRPGGVVIPQSTANTWLKKKVK
jgi:hypothetical protein